MKRSLIVLLLLIFSINILLSQQKKLTVYDCEVGRLTYLKADSKSNLSWRSENGYTFQTDESVIYSTIKGKNDEELVSLEMLNEIHEKNQIKELSKLPFISWINSEVFRYQHDNKLIFYDLNMKDVSGFIEIPSMAENIEMSPDEKYVAYTKENDLFINDRNKGEKTVAQSDDSSIEFGKTVHRNEFGISKGIFWSPNSNYLAFYRNDQSNVTSYPLVNIADKPAQVNSIKYPMAGSSSEHVTIGVYQLSTGDVIYLKTGEPKEQYLTNVQWSPDEKYIYLAILNRDQNHMKLQRYDVATGELNQTLFEERHEKYTEPQHPAIFLKSRQNQFVWQSRKDGFNHLYLYTTDGNLIKQLTKGEWEVTEFIGENTDQEQLIFIGTRKSPTEKNVYAVSLATGEITSLSNEGGVHRVTLNASGRYLIDSYTNSETPKKINIIDTKGNVVKNILTSTNPLKEYALGNSIISKIKAADEKTDLFYRMVLPVDFDSTKKYPVIVYVYNGPHVQLIENQWIGRTELWQHYMAQNGYISFTLDGRGSANRGLEFENVTFRQLGIVEMEDQLKGVEFLKSRSYIDPNRIGLYGWSYGGFMTTSLMLNYPDVFKTGVAGGPVIDWKFYEVMYTERYMDTPEQNPAGYEKTSLLDKAANLKGDLLLIHGAQDPVVVWQHSLTFLRSCIENRRQVDYFVYPTHEHNVRGTDRVHLTEMVSKYLMEHL